MPADLAILSIITHAEKVAGHYNFTASQTNPDSRFTISHC